MFLKRNSDYSDAEGTPRKKKRVPTWAASDALSAALDRQAFVDPDCVFSPHSSFPTINLEGKAFVRMFRMRS